MSTRSRTLYWSIPIRYGLVKENRGPNVVLELCWVRANPSHFPLCRGVNPKFRELRPPEFEFQRNRLLGIPIHVYRCSSCPSLWGIEAPEASGGNVLPPPL